MKAPITTRILASILLLGQVCLSPVAVFADTAPSDSPTPVVAPTPSNATGVSASPSPSDTVGPSPVSDPTTTSPTPISNVTSTASPSPSDTASPSPSVTSNSSPSPSLRSAVSTSPTIGAGVTGPTGTTGTIPKYAFDMTTKFWVPTDASSFAWDPTTGYWLSPLYQYDPAKGYYEIFAAGEALSSNLLTSHGAVNTPLGIVAPGSQKYELAKSLGLLPGDPFMGTTGPGSTNTIGETTNNNTTFDLTNLVNVVNSIMAHSNSGNATASGNTQVGDVSTGAATVVANLVNLLTSAWSWSNGTLNFFMNNLFGNQNGDIKLQPTQSVTGGGGSYGSSNIGTTGADSTNHISTDTNNNLSVRASDGAAITNNLDLAAQSGNASATGNSIAGNATSGDATVEANIINLINSYITAGDSFFGVLNLFGNLNGDILFPQGFVDNAVGSGAGTAGPVAIGTTGPNSTNSIDNTTNNNANLTSATDHSISNNIAASANSGNADISGNSTAGSATTGSAKTSQSLYNLDNTSLFGDNAVLVIVNVMGHWIGHIMKLPDTGASSSALLTGDATIGTTGPNSTNFISNNVNNNADVNSSQTGTITNNINATAKSGDATIARNTQAGNATTGAAKVAGNVANIINSGINMKHWFGVLIVNVFGDWFGSVGDNTIAGNDSAGKGGGGQPVSVLAAAALPHAAAITNQSIAQSNISSGSAGSAGIGESGKTLAATNTGSKTLAAIHQPISSTAGAKDSSSNILLGLSLALLLVAGGLTAIERRIRVR